MTNTYSKKCSRYILMLLLLVTARVNASLIEVTANVTWLQENRWQYSYQISNLADSGQIRQFTFWFDWENYADLALETPAGAVIGWSEVIWQPFPALPDDGGYDILSQVDPLAAGESLSGLTVSFDWLGQGLPSSQLYEIINPDTMATLDSGQTVVVPEPASLLILSLGGLLLKRRA